MSLGGIRASVRSSRRGKEELKKCTLHLQKYYHGALPRSETNNLLLKKGDFLVRSSYKNNAGAQIVISVLHNDGEGHFAVVFSGKMRNAEGKWIPAAIKQQSSIAISLQDKEKFLEEAKILLRLRHRNIVQMYGVCADNQRLLIVMELCPGGNLAAHLQKMVHKLNLDIKLRYCRDSAAGMRYLHMKRIIHRDLAARNCLMGSKGEVKLSDFGLSKEGVYKLAGGSQVTMPVRWSAPEVVLEGKSTEMSDVFSYAVLMWEIFTDAATIPFPDIKTGKEVVKALKCGIRLKFPANTPEAVKALAELCFKRNPDDRPSFVVITGTFNILTNQSDRSNSSSHNKTSGSTFSSLR